MVAVDVWTPESELPLFSVPVLKDLGDGRGADQRQLRLLIQTKIGSFIHSLIPSLSKIFQEFTMSWELP